MSDLIRRSDLLELYEELEGYNIPVDVVIQNIKDMPTVYKIDEERKEIDSTIKRINNKLDQISELIKEGRKNEKD